MKSKTFKEPLFRAAVNGTKTQFREIVKPQDVKEIHNENTAVMEIKTSEGKFVSPRLKVGDKIYLKEPYHIDIDGTISYKFSHNLVGAKWRHDLPKRIARYFIQITAVKCKKVQDISDEDCIKEGIVKWRGLDLYYYDENQVERDFKAPQQAFAARFNRQYGEGMWERNLYVWVYEFQLIKK